MEFFEFIMFISFVIALTVAPFVVGSKKTGCQQVIFYRLSLP